MAKTSGFDDVKTEFIDFMVEHRVKAVLKMCKKMTPIEGIVFLTLIDLVDCFGRHNLNFGPQVKVDQYTVDFMLVYAPLENDNTSREIIIECDGHDFHEKTKEQSAHDKKRDRHLTKKGYTLLRYTGSEIVKDRFKVWRDVEEMLLPEQHQNGFGYGAEFEKMLKELRF